MGNKLYVGNLSFSCTEEQLKALFAEAGNVTSVRIITDRDSGRSKGFGFVEMSNDTEAAKTALVKIGKPAVPGLMQRLDKTTDQDGGLQFQLITLLGEIGPDAAPAAKSIRRVLSQTRNSDVKYAAEAALQAIEK